MKRSRFISLAVFAAAGSTVIAMAGLTGPAVATSKHPAKVTLTTVSKDPYSGDGAQHATEAEPDTFHWNNTVVSVFQVGRFSDGGATNTGWATSTDGGTTWKHGFLPGITVAEHGTWPRVSDPVIAYDAKHKMWLASGLVLNQAVDGAGVVINRSTDGIHWSKPVNADVNEGGDYDKDWVACDNSATSKYYGNCYVEVDHPSGGDQVVMVTSSDGGKKWGPEEQPQGGANGLGGQPLVQPDGTVVVPYSADFGSQDAFSSTDGGKTWSAPVEISNITDHEVPGMREEPLPSASMDAKGKIYVVWDDCRFRSGCSSNDIVMSTSTDGTHWSSVVRIPIDGVKSNKDHFDPGIGVSATQSGKKTDVGLYYYFYPKANCSVSVCKLDVGYVSSTNAGKSWSKPVTLTSPMLLGWLAQAGGAMIGDYISCDILGDTAVSVFAIGFKPKGSVKNQPMASAGPLPVSGGKRLASAQGVVVGPANSARTHPSPLL